MTRSPSLRPELLHPLGQATPGGGICRSGLWRWECSGHGRWGLGLDTDSVHSWHFLEPPRALFAGDPFLASEPDRRLKRELAGSRAVGWPRGSRQNFELPAGVASVVRAVERVKSLYVSVGQLEIEQLGVRANPLLAPRLGDDPRLGQVFLNDPSSRRMIDERAGPAVTELLNGQP
jgi:hypothetical protein